MNNKHKDKFKKRGEKKQLKVHIADVFIYQFIIAIGLCIITFIDMHLFSNFQTVMHRVHIWTFVGTAFLAGLFYFLEVRYEVPKGYIWAKRWFFMFALGSGLLCLHLLLGYIKFNWFLGIREFMGFGSEYKAIFWMYAYIGIGVLVCFVLYLIKDWKLRDYDED
ncbi:hypothetical protein [Treponema sp. R6D11]